ncbi:GNAT family N-acetyltransferase [Microbacterium sp. QXD-8]|jgi:ribosomal protein S18 acetylase RimI-like enzyme|uniref:GNAT family N-acetyltransferase n=1 Tax=Microbacterium psychrotolerans TaxID=3068321 RepID=A0ABU0Z4Q4_9MICO|nr:GNAT family N-acetyltransferase [Microbacterium sp. QXD-8]MDQ7879574.1 GNAT family N-acetyltransferase [Microbacterium sp. QXD-8]
MTFIVRVPDLAEAAEIADLHVVTWRETYTHLLPEGFFDEEYVQGRHLLWRRLLENPREEWRIRVAERDGRIVGLATSGPSTAPEGQDAPRERQLYMLYVLASEYGAGVGQALLDEVVGDEPAVLWVAKENPRAIAFYRRNGFAFDGVEEAYPDVPALVDARMVR